MWQVCGLWKDEPAVASPPVAWKTWEICSKPCSIWGLFALEAQSSLKTGLSPVSGLASVTTSPVAAARSGPRPVRVGVRLRQRRNPAKGGRHCRTGPRPGNLRRGNPLRLHLPPAPVECLCLQVSAFAFQGLACQCPPARSGVALRTPSRRLGGSARPARPAPLSGGALPLHPSRRVAAAAAGWATGPVRQRGPAAGGELLRRRQSLHRCCVPAESPHGPSLLRRGEG